MSDICASCGASIYDHQPILNPSIDGPLYLRGGGISDPGGWTTCDDTGQRAYVQPFVSLCKQYIAQLDGAA